MITKDDIAMLRKINNHDARVDLATLLSGLESASDGTNETEVAAKLKLLKTCSKYGWGWGGAEYAEVSDILEAGRNLERLGKQDAWKQVVNLVGRFSYSAASAGRIEGTKAFIKCVREYGQLIKDEQYMDLDRKSGAEANSAYVFQMADRLEQILAEENKS